MPELYQRKSVRGEINQRILRAGRYLATLFPSPSSQNYHRRIGNQRFATESRLEISRLTQAPRYASHPFFGAGRNPDVGFDWYGYDKDTMATREAAEGQPRLRIPSQAVNLSRFRSFDFYAAIGRLKHAIGLYPLRC